MKSRMMGITTILTLTMMLLPGCNRGTGRAKEVVIYTSVDQPIAEPILREFEKQTGIHVLIQTDSEANKSAYLAARLEAEKDNPRADVWWGNEIFRTINLAEEGILTAYQSPSAADIQSKYRDARHRWAGMGVRARVIAVSALAGREIDSIEQLKDNRYRGKIAMAHPSAGTTSGHMAALYLLWGEPKFIEYLNALRDNEIVLLGGNSVVAEKVGARTVWIGLTDNDDVAAAQNAGGAISMVLPDQKTFGTLALPCTVALVAGSKHPEAAKKLIDFLLSAQVEQRLIDRGFARYSTRQGENSIKTMDIDYAAAAHVLSRATQLATQTLDSAR